MITYILLLHIVTGLLTVIITILPLFGVNKLQSLFIPGYFSVAVSGIGLAALSEQSLSSSCIRFVVVMIGVAIIRMAVGFTVAKNSRI